MDMERMRDTLLDAALAHVPFDGWGEAALLAAAADTGIAPAAARNAFPGGGLEMIEAFSDRADRVMLERLEALDLASMRVRDRVMAGVRERLTYLMPHREAARRALICLALPLNGALGVRCLCRTVDAIWYAAGDTSTDYNYYTKRLLLAGVYSATVLVWLDDGSEGCAETWAFLERRLDEALRLGGTVGRTVNRALDLPERLFGRVASGGARRRTA